MVTLLVELVVALTLHLVLFHVAVAHRATITMVEYEEEHHPGGGRIQSCREEIKKQDLSHCEHYLAICHGHSSGSTEEDVTVVLPPAATGGWCRCQEIREIVREQQREYAGEEMEEIVRAARDLTSVCGVAPQRCEIRAVWF